MKFRSEVKYVFVVGAISVLFTHFIACGAQMYKAKVDDDNPSAAASAGSTDPNSPVFGLHSPGGWTTLPIPYNFDPDMTKSQQVAMQNAMATWEKATGHKLFKFVSISTKKGDNFPDLYSSLQDGQNSFFFRYNWAATGKSGVVLATTIWQNASDPSKIAASDMDFNRNQYIFCNTASLDGCRLQGMDPDGVAETTKGPADLQTVALHETGHMLGLSHIEESQDSNSIMNPSIYIGEGLYSRGLSTGDISRIQRIYAPPSGYMSVTQIAAEIQKDANSGQFGLASQTGTSAAH